MRIWTRLGGGRNEAALVVRTLPFVGLAYEEAADIKSGLGDIGC